MTDEKDVEENIARIIKRIRHIPRDKLLANMLASTLDDVYRIVDFLNDLVVKHEAIVPEEVGEACVRMLALYKVTVFLDISRAPMFVIIDLFERAAQEFCEKAAEMQTAKNTPGDDSDGK